MTMRFIGILSIVLILALTGCRQSVDGTPVSPTTNGVTITTATLVPSYRVSLTTSPAALTVGESIIVFNITDPSGAPVPTQQVQLMRAQGDMTHAGMVPVIEEARAGSFATDQAGRFDMPFNFNMAGDWNVSVTVTLTDGTLITGTLTTSVR